MIVKPWCRESLVMPRTLGNIRAHTNRFRQAVEFAGKEQERLSERRTIYFAATRTHHFAFVVPPRRFRRLSATFEAATRQSNSVHRATVPQGSKVIAWRVRAKINHEPLSSQISALRSRIITGGGQGPVCPECGKPIVLRTARRGSNAGNQFLGCSAYPIGGSLTFHLRMLL